MAACKGSDSDGQDQTYSSFGHSVALGRQPNRTLSFVHFFFSFVIPIEFSFVHLIFIFQPWCSPEHWCDVTKIQNNEHNLVWKRFNRTCKQNRNNFDRMNYCNGLHWPECLSKEYNRKSNRDVISAWKTKKNRPRETNRIKVKIQPNRFRVNNSEWARATRKKAPREKENVKKKNGNENANEICIYHAEIYCYLFALFIVSFRKARHPVPVRSMRKRIFQNFASTYFALMRLSFIAVIILQYLLCVYKFSGRINIQTVQNFCLSLVSFVSRTKLCTGSFAFALKTRWCYSSQRISNFHILIRCMCGRVPHDFHWMARIYLFLFASCHAAGWWCRVRRVYRALPIENVYCEFYWNF